MTDVEVVEAGRPRWTEDDPVPENTRVADYWSGPPEPVRWYFPDGQQWIAFSKMTHGQRSAYNSRTIKELTLEKTTGNARMKADIVGDANILIDVACVDWYILRAGQPVPFSHGSPGSNLAQWMGQADPVLIDSLEKAIRKENPWLNSDLTVKDIDEQIEELNREREEAVKREQGEIIFDLQLQQYSEGHTVHGELHPLLMIYHLMSMVDFNHLPWPGALCDQHPEVIDTLVTIRAAIAAHEKRENDAQQAKMKRR